jgi:hypothetical protein
MATIQFKRIRDIFGEVDPDAILYRDTVGTIWNVRRGLYMWNEIYEPWLAAGNTPLGPDDPWPPLD